MYANVVPWNLSTAPIEVEQGRKERWRDSRGLYNDEQMDGTKLTSILVAIRQWGKCHFRCRPASQNVIFLKILFTCLEDAAPFFVCQMFSPLHIRCCEFIYQCSQPVVLNS